MMETTVRLEERRGVEARPLLLDEDRAQFGDVLGTRLRAAICAIVISNVARASQRWSSVVGKWTNRCRIVRPMSATMRSKDGDATRGRSPWVISMSPMRLRLCMASRIDGRPTA